MTRMVEMLDEDKDYGADEQRRCPCGNHTWNCYVRYKRGGNLHYIVCRACGKRYWILPEVIEDGH